MHTPVSSGQCVFIMYIIALITIVWLKRIIPAYLVVCIHQFHTPVSSGQCVFIMYIIALITTVCLKMIIPAYLVVCIHQFHTPVSSGQCVFIMYIIALITMVCLKMIIPAYLVVCIHQFHTPVSSGQCVFIMYIIAMITMVWLKSIIPAYLSSTYTSFIRSVCLYHVCHCPDNNGMIEKDNTSLLSSMHTPVSSGQFVFIMYIIALITIVCLKMIIPAYLVVCIHQFHQVSVSLSCISLPW